MAQGAYNRWQSSRKNNEEKHYSDNMLNRVRELQEIISWALDEINDIVDEIKKGEAK